MTIGEALSIVSSVVSFFLGGFSVWLALDFFSKTKSTEKEITNSLAKIEQQTAALQKINAKWMDRLLTSVTDDRRDHLDNKVPELLTVLLQLPQAIATQVTLPKGNDSQEELVEELYTCYIIIYYYAALTNYWAQFYLPGADEFEIKNEFHNLTKRVVDGSASDFQHFANILARADQKRLNSNAIANVLEETRTLWRQNVRSAAEVFESPRRSDD